MSNLDAIPADLKGLQQFCVRVGKQPYIKDGTKNTFTASGWSENRKNWLTFNEAVQALHKGVKVWHDEGYHPVDGIGFLVARNGLDEPQRLGGDLDCCRDPESGLVSPWAEAKLQSIRPFYTEVSPSKCGFRYFVSGRLPGERDSISGNGPQDDLPEAAKERILAAKPKVREKLQKGQPAFNGMELYESGRHLTLTGQKVEEYCFPKEDRTEAIAFALGPFLANEVLRKVADNDRRNGNNRLKHLNILDVIDTTGFTESGGQLFGSHPTLGSTTGQNLVIDPEAGVWAYMHNKSGDSAPGGDAWVWLACECGAVAWENAGKGVLKDREILTKTLLHAVDKGLITKEESILDKTLKPEAILQRINMEGKAALKDSDVLKSIAALRRDDPLEYALTIESIKKTSTLKGISKRTIENLVDNFLSDECTPGNEPGEEKGPDIPADILDEANRLLDEGKALEYVLDVWQKRHYGDSNLGKALFLSIGAQSCISSKGIHVHACGPRGMGKSDGTEKASEAIPRDYLLVGSASPKALYYLGERLPAGSIVYLDDIGWNDQAAQMFKTCTTFYKEGAMHTVVVDQEIHQFRTAPRIIFWITTADAQTDEQVRDRLLRIDITEDQRHTKEVIDFIFQQRKNGVNAFNPEELDVCRAIIYLLKQVFIDVVIPFSDYIQFEGDPRGATIFADLVSSYSIWRYRIRDCDANGSVIASYEDYRDAETFFNAIHGHSDSKFTPGELRILQAIKDLGCEATREQIMEKTGLSKGALSDALNGRSRNGQEKYGLLHKCPALTEDEEGELETISDIKKTSRKKRTYKLSRDFDITGAYGKSVYLSADDTTIRQVCSQSSPKFAEGSQNESVCSEDIVRMFVKEKDVRENNQRTMSPFGCTEISTAGKRAKNGELTELCSADSESVCELSANHIRTQTNNQVDDSVSGPANQACKDPESGLETSDKKVTLTKPDTPIICAICGEDLTGKGRVEINGKFYCPKPGCGYPKRDISTVNT